jgi:RNase P subunit RPR2
MEILKDTPEQEYVAKCYKCQTVLKFKASEAKFIADYRESYLEVACPVCGNKVYKNL